MATWIAHLRVAEAIMRAYPELDCDEYTVGNIGPDSGVPNADWSSFTPDANVSHWNQSGSIDAEGFASEYLERPGLDAGSRAFYLGYWTHLLVDRAWNGLVARKRTEPAWAPWAAEPAFIWTIKKDWYGQDVVYLGSNPGCLFFRRFAKLGSFPNRYLDLYAPDAFEKRVAYITGYYLGYTDDLDRAFPYLSAAEMDAFVVAASETVGAAMAAMAGAMKASPA